MNNVARIMSFLDVDAITLDAEDKTIDFMQNNTDSDAVQDVRPLFRMYLRQVVTEFVREDMVDAIVNAIIYYIDLMDE